MPFKTSIVVLLVTLAVRGGALAAPVPTLDLPGLVESADLIVLGSVSSLVDGGAATLADASGPSSATRLLISIAVQRVLKGPADVRIVQLEHLMPTEPRGYGPVDSGSFRMCFVRVQGSSYEFASVYYPGIVAVDSSLNSEPEPLTRVVRAVALALGSDSLAPEERVSAAASLSGVRLPVAITALRGALDSPDRQLAFSALSSLLHSGDHAALEQSVAALEAETDDPELLRGLPDGIRRGPWTTADIPALTRGAGLANVVARRAAATGLRTVASPLAEEAYGRLLDDSDLDVRYQAVMGLFEGVGPSTGAPSWPTFLADPEQYVTWWKTRLAK